MNESEIVAIGTVIDSTERVATLRVDEALRGTRPRDLLAIDNRTPYTEFACSPYQERFHEGNRFARGETLVLILEKKVDGVWQVGFSSDTAWPVPDDELQPLLVPYWGVERAPPSLEALRKDIQASVHRLGSDLDFEARPPCNAVEGNLTRIMSSTAIVIADMEPGHEFATAHIREVIAGDVTQTTIKLNDRTRRSYETCDVVLEPPRSAPYRNPGRYLIFLRPDEFGIGDYRIAYWGFAMEEVNERYVTLGLPTLADIRDAVDAAGPAPAQTLQPEVELGDGSGTSWVGFGVAVLFFTAVAGWIVWLDRRGAGS